MTSEEFDAHSREMTVGIARLRLVATVGFCAALVMLFSTACPWPWAWRAACFVTLACQGVHLTLGWRLDGKQRRAMGLLLADIRQMRAEVVERIYDLNGEN